MIRAAAKNFLRVAPAVAPSDYKTIVLEMKSNNGQLSLKLRFELAQKAFEHTAAYDRTIADYLSSIALEDVKGCYNC